MLKGSLIRIASLSVFIGEYLGLHLNGSLVVVAIVPAVTVLPSFSCTWIVPFASIIIVPLFLVIISKSLPRATTWTVKPKEFTTSNTAIPAPSFVTSSNDSYDTLSTVCLPLVLTSTVFWTSVLDVES